MHAQCPTGDVTLSSQEAVDEFVTQFGNCEIINGNFLLVTGLTNDGNGVSGTLLSNITNTSGLNNIKIIRGDLTITIESSVLDDFTSLEEVSREISITNSENLLEINGFNALRSAGSIVIANNNLLQKINGFNSVVTLEESLEIGRLAQVTSVEGFSNLQRIGGQLNISDNLKLEHIPNFSELITIDNDLNFNSNPNLQSADGFEKLVSVGNDFNIENVTTISGFLSLETVGRYFNIEGKRVTSIPSFNNVKQTGGAFRIFNTSIGSFSGFNQLTSTGKTNILDNWFVVSNNTELVSVSGFGMLNFVDGNLEVQNNTRLSDCSWLCAILNSGEITGNLIIQNNLGDCINAAAVIEICNDDFDNDGIPNILDVDDDNDGILDSIEGSGIEDADNDGYPNRIDLDADGDGCFDVIEAGFSDPNNDGILGGLPFTTDNNGRIIGQGGYTIPNDRNSNSVLDFLEKSTLDPGEDTIKEYCFNEVPFSLFSALSGTPDPGGVWSPALSSGTDVFDPEKDSPGIYTYTHSDSFCGDRVATLELKLISDVRAGSDTELYICGSQEKIDLFKLLPGNPSAGGFWTPRLESGTSVFDPELDKAEVYKYSIRGRECGTVSAQVRIIQSKKPYAGQDNSIAICEFERPINLLELLGEDADTNGVWSNNLVNGMFDPSIHPSGTYTYTVDNGNCGVDSASVNVQVIQDTVLNNVTVKVNDFSAKNNNIQVYVFSTRKYQYSLDGINYQDDYIFNSVPGGKHMVYVRGVDGCEHFSKEVFVRTYPTFFTPNGDGYNDFWNLYDFPDEQYTIYIYNRYGSLVKQLNQHQYWDGTLNGKPLQAADYWFKVITDKGEILQGNFSLLRN